MSEACEDLPRLREAVRASGLTWSIAERMTMAKATIPQAWQAQEVDMAGVVANRATHKVAFRDHEGFSLTFPVVCRGCTRCRSANRPAVNATFSGERVLVHAQVNVGVAIGSEARVIVPVIRGADLLSIAGIARAANALATRAREKRLGPDDLSGTTFASTTPARSARRSVTRARRPQNAA